MSNHVIVLIGPPGSGKGTQAALLANLLHMPVISTGDILRQQSESGSDLGNRVKACLETGGLVDDNLINQVVAQRVIRADCRGGFLLDGYPRTLEQAAFFDRLLDSLKMPRPSVVHIDVPMDPLITRLSGRLHCCVCGAIYNTHYRQPAHQGFCDNDDMPLIRRADDSEEVIYERLRHYHKATAPLIVHYSNGNFHAVDGTGSPAAVLESIEAKLGLYA